MEVSRVIMIAIVNDGISSYSRWREAKSKHEMKRVEMMKNKRK